jgi:hypothetical protein
MSNLQKYDLTCLHLFKFSFAHPKSLTLGTVNWFHMTNFFLQNDMCQVNRRFISRRLFQIHLHICY